MRPTGGANTRSRDAVLPADRHPVLVGSMRIDVEVVGGRVAPVDEAYARGQLDYLRRNSSRAVQCGSVRLCAGDGADVHEPSNAAVDAVLVLDADLLVCAGAVGTTMRAAIDEVASRLRRRVSGDREELSRQRRSRAAVTAVSP